MAQPKEYICEHCGKRFDPNDPGEGIVYIVAGAGSDGSVAVDPDAAGTPFLAQMLGGPLNAVGESVARREYAASCFVQLFSVAHEEVDRVALAVEAGNDPQARDIARAARKGGIPTAEVMQAVKAERAAAQEKEKATAHATP